MAASSSIARAAASPAPTAPLVAVAPSSAAVSADINITGSGFPPNEVVGLYFDKPGSYIGFPGPRADSQGNFHETDAVPAIKPGSHELCADTMNPSPQAVAAKVCIPFQVIAPAASPTPTPSSPQRTGLNGLPLAIVFLLVGVLIGIGTGAAIWGRKQPGS